MHLPEKPYQYPDLTRLSMSPFLDGLKDRDQILRSARKIGEPNLLHNLFEHPVIWGTQELIDMYNEIDPEDKILTLPSLSRTKALKNRVQELPNLEDLSPREFAFGLVNAHHRIMDGQNNKDINRSIGTPSMDIPPEIKAIGIGLHVIERTMFAHFRNTRPDLEKIWYKDEILFALEDMAQLHEAGRKLGFTTMDSAILFRLINTPNKDNGLGWRNPDNLARITEELKGLYE